MSPEIFDIHLVAASQYKTQTDPPFVLVSKAFGRLAWRHHLSIFAAPYGTYRVSRMS
jgi:hypothetical protein